MSKNANLTLEEFLDSWEPSPHLEQACLPQNLDDPVAIDRLTQDVEAVGDVPRVVKVTGTYNGLEDQEAQTRRLDFLEEHQPEWSDDFRKRMIAKGVDSGRLDTFIDGMANVWVKGPAVRQKSTLMLSIKASIQAHDRYLYQAATGKFVIDDGNFGAKPLFDWMEVCQLFQTNMEILSYAIPDYVTAVFGDRAGSVDSIYTRRGVCMPHEPKPLREEASYLSSYSLAIGPTELFAQTMAATSAPRSRASLLALSQP